jgi:hypothetical protein
MPLEEGMSQPQSVNMLAQQTQSYAKSVEALLKRPAPAATARDAAKAAPAESNAITETTVAATVTPPASDPPKPQLASAPSAANARAAVSAAPPPVATNLTNTPAAIPAASQTRGVSSSPPTDGLHEKLAKRVKEYPRDVSAQLEYQLLLLLRDQPVPDVSAIASLPGEDREIVSAVIDGLSNFRNTLRADNNTLVSRKIRPLVDLVDRLKAQADLNIPTLALCTRVDGYGRYDAIDPPRFRAGRPESAIVYCEIENFSSVQNAAQRWETDLTQQVVLYAEANDQALMVWSDQPEAIKDESRNRRRDFFVRKRIDLPPTLIIGRYLLKVTIVDKQANRIAEASTPIQVVAGEVAAGK